MTDLPDAAAATEVAATEVRAKRPITQEDIWLMRRVGNPVASPDGRFLAVPVGVPAYDPAKETGDIWIVAADGSAEPRCLTDGHGLKAAPAWSPDGSQLAFVTKAPQDHAPQVYLVPAAGGAARRVTNQPTGARAPAFRPDGTALLFEATNAPPPKPGPVAAPRIYDAMPVRFWNRWLDAHRPHPFVLELRDGATPRDLLHGTGFAASAGFRGIFRASERDTVETLQAQWSPDGQSVVFAAQANADAMMHTAIFTSLFQLSVNGGEPVALTNAGESYSDPQFTRGGDALFAIIKHRATEFASARLARMSWPSPANVAVVTDGWERVIEGYTIAPDGETIYLDAADDGLQRVFCMPAAGGPPEPVIASQSGAWRALTPVAGGLVALYETALQPPELMRLGTPPVPLTRFNADRLADIDAPEPIHFRFTASNGKTIHNVMFRPAGFDPARKYPIVTFIHGGPASMSTDAFTYSAFWFHPHLLATPGYVVLETNYTGSIGFGAGFAHDVESDVLRGPAGEIIEALDEAARRFAFVDADRQAAVGGSYGGYLVNWLNGHTDRFRCLVSHVGPFNNESQYGTNDGGLDRETRMGGPIWDGGGQWMDQSPMRYARHFATPTLVTHGERDFRVPLGEGLANFKLLQRLEVPSRFVVFPDEGHMIGHGENARVFWREVSAWLARFL